MALAEVLCRWQGECNAGGEGEATEEPSSKRLRAHHGLWDPDHDGDLASYRLFNLVRDVMGLLDALGRTEVALLAGHDFGASVAAWAALIRPDIFHKLALMSAPFPGPPDITPQPPPARSIHDELAALDRPRKHYQWYYSTRQANREMQDCPQGVHAFLRAYFHHKSADWAGTWLVDGAGHWVQQEQPDAVSARLTAFASGHGGTRSGARHGADPVTRRMMNRCE